MFMVCIGIDRLTDRFLFKEIIIVIIIIIIMLMIKCASNGSPG